MKKNYLLEMWSKLSVIAVITLFGFNQQTIAQLTGITVSEGSSETWYYIESGHSSKYAVTSNDGRFGGLISSNGATEKADLDLLRPDNERASQRWKVVAVNGEDEFYYLINENGEYFHKGSDSFYASTADPGDSGKYNLIAVTDTTKYYTIRRKGRTDNETKLEVLNQENGFAFTESENLDTITYAVFGITGSPRSWRFVPIAELDTLYPKIYPVGIAVADVDSWYYLKIKASTAASTPYLTLTETSNVFRAKNTVADDSQLFAFISSGRTSGENGSPVRIISKAYPNKYVGVGKIPIAGWPEAYYPNGALLADNAHDWYIGHVVKPVDDGVVQNVIRGNRDGDYLTYANNSKSAVTTAKSAAYSGENATGSTYDGPYNWIFEKAPEGQGASIKPVLSDDRLLKTQYYTLYGTLVPAPNSIGVYIAVKTYASGKTEASKIIWER